MTKTFNTFRYTLVCLLVLSGLIITHSSLASPHRESEEELAKKLMRSIEVSRQVPYHGVLHYTRYFPDGQETIRMEINKYSPNEKVIKILSPEPWAGSIFYKKEQDIWVSPLEKDKRQTMSKETRKSLWERLFDDEETIGFGDDMKRLLENYNLVDYGREKVAGDDVYEIKIDPKHSGRPHILLCLEKESLKQVKFRYYGVNGKLQEKFEFDAIHVGKPNQEARPDVSELLHLFPDDEEETEVVLDFDPLQPTFLPEGFRLFKNNQWEHKYGPVFHSVYTDSIASVSIYQRKMTQEEVEKLRQEKQESKEPVIKEVHHHGRQLFIRETNGLRISIMGEVPDRTLHKMLLKMRPPAGKR